MSRHIDTKATGEHIRNLCDAMKYSPEDISRMLNLDLSTIYYWFQGKTLPRWDIAVTLADILNCKIDDLIITVSDEETDEDEQS